MDQRSLPMGYTFFGHEPIRVCCDLPECAIRIQLNSPDEILRWLTTVLMEYKSTIFNSFEKGSKLFFPSLFNACLSLLPFYVKFEQLNVNKRPK